MSANYSKKNVISSFLWRFFERVGAQGVKLIVEIVLARLLLPDDYGLIALVTVFITVLNVFVDSGLANALIQKKDADDIDFSSVFWFNIIWCIVLYAMLFAGTPFLARFYARPELIPVLRVLGLQVIISGVKNVEQAYVSRTMQFKKFFFATLGGTIGAAVIGIWMAYHGYGVWALVAQQLFNTLVDTIILWLTVKWRPKFVFSFERFKGLFSFGWKLLVSSLLDTVYNEIRQLVIGKIYTASDLAYYNRGRQFPHLFITNVNSAIDSVLLPTMSKEQDDRGRVKAMTRKAIQISTFIIAPLMMGLAFAGEPVVRLILTEKWLPCVPYMRVFCFAFVVYPIHTANLNAIKAMGRSDLFLKLEIVKKVLGLVLLLLTMNISVMAMAYSMLATSLLGQLVNSWPNRKLLSYRYWDQMKDILPNILLAVLMGFCILQLERLGLPDTVTLLLQILLGAFIYLGGARLTKNESLQYLLGIVRPHWKKYLKKTGKP